MTKTPNPPLCQLKTNRDILLFQFPNDQLIVVACDSSGGIGPKPLDKVKVSGFTLGGFTARSALMEIISAGAAPICIVDALGIEPNPLGAEILAGIREEAKLAGLDPNLAVTGSTEKNIIVQQTGIGVTAIGTCQKNQLKIGTSQPDDLVAAIGLPSVGDQVLPSANEGKIAETTDLIALLKLDFVHEIIPVGSTGVLHEIQTLAQGAKLNYKLAEQTAVDIHKSAGPSTVLLATMPKDKFTALKNSTTKPANPVATLSK